MRGKEVQNIQKYHSYPFLFSFLPAPFSLLPPFLLSFFHSLAYSILNKITPEKFQKLSGKLADLFFRITDVDHYTEAVGLVFDKALSEPNFSKMYSELCARLNSVIPSVPEADKVCFSSVMGCCGCGVTCFFCVLLLVGIGVT